jgi:hypothetical protein
LNTKKFFFSVFAAILVFSHSSAQTAEETNAWLARIKRIVNTENSGSHLVYRLDTLKSEFIPSRSTLNEYFNRELDFGFKHRRLTLQLNFSWYQIDLVCFNDTIVASAIGILDYYLQNELKDDHYNTSAISILLAKRNVFYHSRKDAEQLIREISLSEMYAFNCGLGGSRTEEGKHIDQLVEDRNAHPLIDMIKNFNCETQAFGLAGLEMLEKKGYHVPVEVKKIMAHVRKRNSDLVICSGCIMGLVRKIY